MTDATLHRSPADLAEHAPKTLSLSQRIVHAVARGPLHIIVILIGVIWFVPTFGLLVSSFRPANDIASTGWWAAFLPPYHFLLDNYVAVLTANGMAQGFINSLLIAIPGTVLPILIGAFGAYAFSWMQFPGRDWFFIVVVGLLVVPVQMTLIPILQVYNRFHLTGTFPGIWLAHTAYGLPLVVFLLHNF